MKYLLPLLLCAFFLQPSPVSADSSALIQADTKPEKKLTDNEIKKILIKESIDAYSGSCPCPYSRTRNGSKCGKRSAWSRKGGEAPLCYKRDVTKEMVQEYRDRQSRDQNSE